MVEEALSGDDLSAIHDTEMHQFFRPDELTEFLARVQADLESILDSVQRSLISKYDYDCNPESQAAGLSEDLELILATHADWPGIQAIISDQQTSLDDWVFEVTGGHDRSEPLRRSGNLMPSLTHCHERSIFDDIDG